MDDCIFCGIAAGTIPADVVYRDEQLTAFRDLDPQAPIHILVIPNAHIASTNDLGEQHAELLGRLLLGAASVARDLGVAEGGYRVVINTGRDGNQTVPHLHLHVVGGRRLGWPPG